MSTFATDPNMHEAKLYEGEIDALVAVSRDLQERGRLRLDVIRMGSIEEALLPGIILEPDDALELASHILNAQGISSPHANPNMALLWRRIGDLLGAPGDEMRTLGRELQAILEGRKR